MPDASSSKSMMPTAPLKNPWLMPLAVAALISIGLVMVASASISNAAETYGNPWHYLTRHCIYLALALCGMAMVTMIPMDIWQRLSWPLLLFAILLLVAVLVPGLGRRVNGALRWIAVGPFSVQPAEVAKFCVIVFFASFLTRRYAQIRHWGSFLIPFVLLGIVAVLLLAEPDFGSVVVISLTVMAMVFLAGARLPHTFVLVMLALGALVAIAIASPYRLERLSTFMDPWAAKFSGGYQLTQSLIAFGQGEWAGVGLGNSVQKLLYLPEAHTDFVFAVLSEEWGLAGGLVVIALFVVLIQQMLKLVSAALLHKRFFDAMVVFGVAVLFAGQAFINMGVASGLLPTKGLTLPFVSFGGSSLIVCSALFALVLRVQYELARGPVQQDSAKKDGPVIRTSKRAANISKSRVKDEALQEVAA